MTEEQQEYERNEKIVKKIEYFKEWFEKEELNIALRPGDEIRLMSGGGSLGIIPYEYETLDGEKYEWDIIITLDYFLGHPFIVVDEWYEKVIRNSLVIEPNGYIEFPLLDRIYRIPLIITNKNLIGYKIINENIIIKQKIN